MKVLVKLLIRFAPLYFLIASVKYVGWSVYVDNMEGDEIVEGMIIGTSEFIDRYAKRGKK